MPFPWLNLHLEREEMYNISGIPTENSQVLSVKSFGFWLLSGAQLGSIPLLGKSKDSQKKVVMPNILVDSFAKYVTNNIDFITIFCKSMDFPQLLGLRLNFCIEPESIDFHKMLTFL
jgi:hypothetical protein